MGNTTGIEWCHHTFNPWWGCTKISPGCKNCYAEEWDARFKGAHWGIGDRRFFGDKHWKTPERWNRQAAAAGERRRVFCASMADVFEIHPNPEMNELMNKARRRLWRLIKDTPHLDWLLLTKRPENARLANSLGRPHGATNAWLGVTAENQERADERIPLLLKASWPSQRFVSYEPALTPVDFDPGRCPSGCTEKHGRIPWCPAPPQGDWQPSCGHCGDELEFGAWLDPLNDGIGWVIVGGESGSKARPMKEDWVRSVRDQCAESGTPFFYKQRLDHGMKVSLPTLDGVVHAEFPTKDGD